MQRPASIRLIESLDPLRFVYLNPGNLAGPNEGLPTLPFIRELHPVMCLGIVIGGAGALVSVADADELVLGLAPLTAFRARAEEGARQWDLGCALGPAITTPDELDDAVTVDSSGRRYRFSLTMNVNGEEVAKVPLADRSPTVAEALAYVSESAPLRQGDVVALALAEPDRPVGPGDQIQILSDKLGVLTNRVLQST
jgi:2-keto-4-pentenoate hydratase/2-oxohepta-3-ene-1,7-dioic acid hydratase in catechol pathway